MENNGIFILNVFKPNRKLDETWIFPKTKQWENIDEETGTKVVKNHTGLCIDTTKQLIDVEFEYCVTGKDGSSSITDTLKLKYYYYGQIRELLLSEGLEIVEEYGYYDRSTINNGPEMILICRKKVKKALQNEKFAMRVINLSFDRGRL
jgi:hypothetical protein